MNKQQLNVTLSIPIPEDMILIKKVELEELQQQKLSGRWWTIEDLENRTGRKKLWLRNNLLCVPKFKKELEKFVHYPNSQGDKWSFHAPKMAKFLDDNFYLIFNR